MSLDDNEPYQEEASIAGAIVSLVRFLRPGLRSHQFSLAVLGLGLLVEMAFNAAFPLTLKFLIDNALLARSQRMLFLILAVLAAAGLLASAVAVLYEWINARVSALILRDLRQSLFEHLQTLSHGFYTRARTGEILARFSGDVVTIEDAVTTVLSSGILPLLEVIASTLLLFALRRPTSTHCHRTRAHTQSGGLNFG